MQTKAPDTLNQIKIGRFAPSPTGALHFGSLIAAVASYLCSRQHPESKWLLRIEDVDTERKKKGATSAIINTLEAYGFKWDDEITYQSERIEFYQTALNTLTKHIYPCSCSRKELLALSTENIYGYNYPSLCRNGIQNTEVKNPSIRLLTNNKNNVCFQDECQTEVFCQSIESDVGDFILKRRDGLFAYQLAVVVDDYLQDINHIVRGADLFDNTPRQIYLQRLLGYTTPSYLHFPVAVTQNGKKLSKQNLTTEISVKKPAMIKNIHAALTFLGQTTPDLKHISTVDEIWEWAILHFNPNKIPKTMKVVYEEKK